MDRMITLDMICPAPLDADAVNDLVDTLDRHSVGGVAQRPGEAWISTTITISADDASAAAAGVGPGVAQG